MFAGIDVRCLPRRHLHAAVADALNLLGFSHFEHAVVGNLEALDLNDLDIAISRSELASHLGLASEGCLWSALAAYLEKASIGEFVILEAFNQFQFATPIPGSRTGRAYVKTDVFVGNIDWIRALASGAPLDSRYKAIYRNMLLMSVFLELRWPTECGEAEYYRYALNFRDGLRIRRFRMMPAPGHGALPRRMTLEESFATSNPDDVARILFDGCTGWTDIHSFETLYQLLRSERFRYSGLLPAIERNFLMSLGRNGMSSPDGFRLSAP